VPFILLMFITIRLGWNKFRQLVPLLTNKDIDSEREIVQQLCAKQYVAWK